MSLTPRELELHRQLLAAFNDYVQSNLRWEEKGFYTESKRARKALRQIIDLAYLRWKEIGYVRKGEDTVPEMGNEFFRQIVKKHSKSRSKGDDEEEA